MTTHDNAYVIRESRRVSPDLVSYTIVDMAGAVVNVSIPFDASTDHRADEALRAALAARHPAHKPVR